MSLTYLEIKRFVDEQISILNRPFTIDDEVRKAMSDEDIPESKVKSLQFKCNLLLKRHNRAKLNKQIVHQIVQQIVKAESESLQRANESLEKVLRLARPVVTDNFALYGSIESRIDMLNALADELPESRYLLHLHNDSEATEESANTEKADKGETEEMLLDIIQDHGEPIEKEHLAKDVPTAAVQQGILKREFHRDNMLNRYDKLREQLFLNNEEVLYNMEKEAYLRKLNRELELGDDVQLSGEDIAGQISRFKILVEKLSFEKS